MNNKVSVPQRLMDALVDALSFSEHSNNEKVFIISPLRKSVPPFLLVSSREQGTDTELKVNERFNKVVDVSALEEMVKDCPQRSTLAGKAKVLGPIELPSISGHLRMRAQIIEKGKKRIGR